MHLLKYSHFNIRFNTIQIEQIADLVEREREREREHFDKLCVSQVQRPQKRACLPETEEKALWQVSQKRHYLPEAEMYVNFSIYI